MRTLACGYTRFVESQRVCRLISISTNLCGYREGLSETQASRVRERKPSGVRPHIWRPIRALVILYYNLSETGLSGIIAKIIGFVSAKCLPKSPIRNIIKRYRKDRRTQIRAWQKKRALTHRQIYTQAHTVHTCTHAHIAARTLSVTGQCMKNVSTVDFSFCDGVILISPRLLSL